MYLKGAFGAFKKSTININKHSELEHCHAHFRVLGIYLHIRINVL